MAHGLPDYYRGMRPRYGEAQLLRVAETVTANDTTLIGSISGKGMIYGGHVCLDYTSVQGQSEVALFVDDNDIGSKRFDRLLQYGLFGKHSYATYLLKKDELNYVYVAGILPGITFETSFKIYYTERHGTTPGVAARVIYALI